MARFKFFKQGSPTTTALNFAAILDFPLPRRLLAAKKRPSHGVSSLMRVMRSQRSPPED
jgi:hypothetical protein